MIRPTAGKSDGGIITHRHWDLADWGAGPGRCGQDCPGCPEGNAWSRSPAVVSLESRRSPPCLRCPSGTQCLWRQMQASQGRIRGVAGWHRWSAWTWDSSWWAEAEWPRLVGPGEQIYSSISDDKQIKINMINPTFNEEMGDTYRRSRGSLYTLFSLWTSSSLNSRNHTDSVIALAQVCHPYCDINTVRVFRTQNRVLTEAPLAPLRPWGPWKRDKALVFIFILQTQNII